MLAPQSNASRTTGLPKGAILTHGSLPNNAKDIVRDWGFTDADVNLHALPFYHVHGLYYSLHCSLFSHSTIIAVRSVRNLAYPGEFLPTLPKVSN
uniref:AMP-binding domain-containing protein n=1 Tax=Caenorhabditis japonica TaxID=281687 RepID=A0A8R1HZG7_CAEJA